MIKSISLFILLLCTGMVQAQEVIKTGEESSITCTGSFIAEAQHYYSAGKPSSVTRLFMDVKGDSLVFYTAVLSPGKSSQTVFLNVVAKSDIDTGDWGLPVEKLIENSAPFQVLQVKTVDGNMKIREVKYSHDEEEVYDATNRVHIYFEMNKEEEAKQWAAKIRSLLQ